MKIRCSRCQQKFNVADEWGGKTIRCSGCNKAFTIPKPAESDLPLPGEKTLDLESLAKLESRTGEMDTEDLASAEADLAAIATQDPDRKKVRTCPNCNKAVPEKDPFVELLCSNCWQPIPALKKAAGFTTGGAVLVGAKNIRDESKIGFYEGLATANAYPIGALGSLLLAAAVAIGSILLPVLVTTAFARATEQSQAGLADFRTEELTGVQQFLTIFFYIQVLFFAGVGVHAFVDVTRTTAIGEEKPPPLVWNPSSWGDSILGYLALLAYYAVFFLIAVSMSSDQFAFPKTRDDFQRMLTPGIIALLAVATFIVPMTLIGLSVGKVGQALNPARIFKSIAATHVNYVFLFLLVSVYMSFYVALFTLVLKLFSDALQRMERAAAAGDIAGVAVGLVSWGLVMSAFFYFVYVLGRLHGLFARTFRKKIQFSS